MPELERRLRDQVGAGRRLFVPYVTGGLPGVDADLLRGLADTGADAIEVGLPFSDPVIDGPVIQESSRRALEKGTTTETVLELVAQASASSSECPVIVMTYLNPVLVLGYDGFLERATEAGVSGVIVPDLPVDEAADWCEACAKRDVACILLAAPGTATERLRRIANASRGFVYCVSTYGVTGERGALAGTAHELVDALRPLTTRPLVVGVGIGTPEAAREACEFADGVVVGSALVRPMLDGDRDGMLQLARSFRDAVA
jgi:tryptophan synthase alpha chain